MIGYCEDCHYNQYQKLMWKCKWCDMIEILEQIREKL